MRSRYIVTYDISDPTRWRKVFRTMRGFGDAVQYSVFRCDLSPSERVMLIEALTDIINHREDRVMLVNVGPVDGRGGESIEMLGCASPSWKADRLAVIV